jgi:hypothetical protein
MHARIVTSRPKGETVPFLRMSGRWLEKHGFSIDGDVYMEAGEGRLVLTNYATNMAEVLEPRA